MLSIQQPYFLPWLGFFAKLKYADQLLVLDDVFFSKRHYVDRTKIINMNHQVQWINVPVGQNMHKRINEVQIDTLDWIEIVLKTLKYSYKRSYEFQNSWLDVVEIFEEIRSKELLLLSEINILIIQRMCELLDCKTIIQRNSMFSFSDEPTLRILDACRYFGEKCIVVGDGNGSFAQDYRFLNEHEIGICSQKYYEDHPKYFQLARQMDFQKGLSVVDALLCIGVNETKKIISIVEPKIKIGDLRNGRNKI